VQKQAVEICFDRALGHVQIASDFRVVTSLEQQIDDLPFPWSQLAEFFFHKYCTCPTPQTRRLARKVGPPHIWIRVSHSLNLHSRGQSAFPDVTLA